MPENKPKRKDLNEAPLQQWGQLETIPMKTIHIDHKGPLRQSSHGKNFCLVVIDALREKHHNLWYSTTNYS